MLTETGVISIVTMGFAFLTGALGFAYKSKCSNFKCCCIDVTRDIKTELKEDMPMFPITRSPSTDKDRSPTSRHNITI